MPRQEKFFRKSFSMIEILLVLSLVVSLGSLFSWNLYQRYQIDQFSLALHRLESWMRLCQRLATIHGADVVCQFRPHNKGWEIETGFSLGKGFLPQRKAHKEIFEGIFFSWEGKEEPFLLHFSSTGKVYPEGEIEMVKSSRFSHKMQVSEWSLFQEKPCKTDFFPKEFPRLPPKDLSKKLEKEAPKKKKLSFSSSLSSTLWVPP